MMFKKAFSHSHLPFTLAETFRFQLWAFSSKKLFPTAICLLPFAFCLCALSSCKFNAPIQGTGTTALQGEWKQDSVKAEGRLVNYSLYTFRFSCDSFFVRMESFSKVNFGADTCMNRGHWFEYAKGSYEQSTDTVHVKGFYCNADYSLKKEGGCFNSGVYEDRFKMKVAGDSALTFLPLSSSIALKLKLVKRIACVPKPL